MKECCFGSNLVVLRAKMELSQFELACQLNLDSSTISAYERGTRIPSLMTCIHIAEFIGISLDELILNE